MKESPTAYARAYLGLTHGKKAAELADVSSRFWQAVFRRKRFGWRKQIVTEVARLWQETHGETAVRVAVAHELTHAQHAKLVKELGEALKSDVTLEVEVKPHLLAGAIVTVGDKRYDASLKGRLDNLYRTLSGSER